jgi:Ni/Co efflux regulator RcnB
MKNVVISTFALCLAVAVPTALWAADEQHQPSSPSGGEQSRASGGMATEHVSRPAGSSMHRAVSTRPVTRTHTVTHHPVTVAHVPARTVEKSHVNVDIATYHKNFTAERRFHYGTYRGPAGYAYRRWTFGERLPAEYYASDFWIPNYLNFGMAYAPDGYVWVRYGSDAILIDDSTGEIIQVEYDVFY